MADYGFIANPQQQSAFRQIGEVLNFARGATALQRERATLETDIAQRKAESSSAQTAADLARQTLQPKVEQQQAQTSSAQTQATASRWKLDTEQATKAYEVAGGLAQDPRIVKGDPAGSVDALMSAEDQMRAHKIPEANIRLLMAPLYGVASKDPTQLRQALDNVIRSNAGASAQAGVINAPVQLANTGAELKPVQLQPGAQGGIQPGASPIPQQLPLGERQNVSTNPVTNSPQTTTKDAAGNLVSVTPTVNANAAPNVPQLAPGQPQDIPILTQTRSATNSAAAKVPETRFNNAQIIKLADETNTGKGAEIIRNLKGGYAMLPWTADTAKNFDSLGHFIARESANMISSMGANTDASRGIAEQANVSTGWTRDAVKTAAKVNDALATGLQNYNKGMEAAIQKNGGNVLAVRPFQNAWSAAFDPNVYRYANALESGDKAEIAKILGPDGSAARKAKAAELARKSSTLFRLSTEGQ